MKFLFSNEELAHAVDQALEANRGTPRDVFKEHLCALQAIQVERAGLVVAEE